MAWSDFFKPGRLGRKPKIPQRDTFAFPNTLQPGQLGGNKRVAYKATPRNLRWFSKTPYARRAINSIKNPISMLDWEIIPLDKLTMNIELEKQIEIASYCLHHPNNDDSFRTLLEQIVEDILHGAAAIEVQPTGDDLRPLWLWPVDGLTIQIFPGWVPGSKDARYAQVVGAGGIVGGGNQQVLLRDEELIYFRPNPSTATPFGLGQLEVAFNSISRMLGVGEFAGNVSSNARPSFAIDMGEGASTEMIATFRAYWRNEVEGQGVTPIMGMATEGSDGKRRGPSVLRLYPEGDAALFLKYQEFLKAEIATSFDLSPQNLGVERDVNRNTAEVAEDRDRAQAIKPTAALVASHMTRHVLHRSLGFSQLQFRFRGIDQEDEEALAKVYQLEYASNGLTPNEYRERRGWVRSENPFADMLKADVDIAMQAARGAGQIDDPDLEANPEPEPPPKSKPKRNAK